jgi:hypothetical protein
LLEVYEISNGENKRKVQMLKMDPTKSEAKSLLTKEIPMANNHMKKRRVYLLRRVAVQLPSWTLDHWRTLYLVVH